MDDFAHDIGVIPDVLEVQLRKHGLRLVRDYEGWGKFDDQTLADAASEAYGDGEGRFSVSSFKRQLDDAGLCIVGKGYDDADLIERLQDALHDQDGSPKDDLRRALEASSLKLVPVERDRGDGRQAHYGSGEQPWDTCLRLGWAQYGAAFSILRYLRRTKEPERDLRHARVYLFWLYELAKVDKGDGAPDVGHMYGNSLEVFRMLLRLLTADELERLGVTEAQLAL